MQYTTGLGYLVRYRYGTVLGTVGGRKARDRAGRSRTAGWRVTGAERRVEVGATLVSPQHTTQALQQLVYVKNCIC